MAILTFIHCVLLVYAVKYDFSQFHNVKILNVTFHTLLRLRCWYRSCFFSLWII